MPTAPQPTMHFPTSKYMAQRTSLKLFAPDGTDLKHTVNHEYIANCGGLEKLAADHGYPAGTFIVTNSYESELTRSDQVFYEARIPAEDANMVRLDANRMRNTVGGVPSACMASACAAYKRDPAAFREQRERDHQDDIRVRDLERAHIRAGRINLDRVGL